MSSSARPATAAPRRQPRRPPSRQPRRNTRRSSPRPRRAAPRAPRLRVRWDRAGRVSMLIVLAIVLGLYVQHALSYLSTRAQASTQQALVDRLTRQNAALTRQQQSLNDPSTIVSDARALGMVRPNERPYVIIGHPGH